MERHITVPVAKEEIQDLRAGDYVYLTGVIYTARDAAHKRMDEVLSEGKELPLDIKNQMIYYMGPSPAREGRPIGSAGPTTATHIQNFASNVWNMYDNSDIRVVSGNYLKCSSMTIRYNLSSELLKKTPFSNISLSLNALNLFTLSAKELKGQDPSQAGFAKPNLSVRPSYTFQFNVTF